MKTKPGYPFRFEVKDRAFKKLIQMVLEKLPLEPKDFPIFKKYVLAWMLFGLLAFVVGAL